MLRMKVETELLRKCRQGWIGIGVVCCLLVGSGAVFAENASVKKTAAKAKVAATGRVTQIELTARLADGQKKWLPATVEANKGKVEFTLINTLPEPHGFNIRNAKNEPMLKEPLTVLPNSPNGPNKPPKVVVDFPNAGDYKLECNLHPTHVGAKLTVK